MPLTLEQFGINHLNPEQRMELIGLIWDTVSPQSRKDRNQRLLQQNLEELAANDLFIAAVNLKQLA